jgi:hypothetical protein
MIFRFNRQEKCYGRKIRRLAADATRARNEADDFRAHDIASHTAMATRNISASEIRYAVIHCLSSLKRKMRGMIADDTIISGANPIPWEHGGRGQARHRAPPTGAFARAGQYGWRFKARTATRVRQRKAREWDVLACAPPSDCGNEKARRRFRRGLSNLLRWCQYVADLPDESNSMKMRQMNCGQSKPDLQACVA